MGWLFHAVRPLTVDELLKANPDVMTFSRRLGSGLGGNLAIEPLTHLDDFLGLDLNVGGLPAHPAQRLVQQEAGEGQAEAVLALCACERAQPLERGPAQIGPGQPADGVPGRDRPLRG